MGCDIYLYVEHYNKESKRWENLFLYKKSSEGEFLPVDIYDGRDYDLFGLLAGVLSVIDPFVLPRGVPEDMSCEVSKAYGDGECYYAPTWYDYCELQAYEYMMTDSLTAIQAKDKKINKLESQVKQFEKMAVKSNDGEEYIDDCFKDIDAYPDYYDILDLPNRLTDFMNCIKMVLNAYDIYYPKPGEVRAIMWFDS